MKTKRPSKEVVEALRRFPTSLLSDVLDQMGVEGTITHILPISTNVKIAGPALTVRSIAGDLGTADIKELGVGRILDEAHPGDVIVFDLGGRSHASTWGELASLAAKVKGIEGVVIDGACRDVDEIREEGFPVFTRSVVPRSGKTRVKMLDINVPIQCGEVMVRPGDIIVGDGTGVVAIPPDRAEEAVKIAERLEEIEEREREELLKGRSFSEIMRKYRHF
ncbi:MAG: RraA family protein [Candidatus Geothermarchaeales archaeon]